MVETLGFMVVGMLGGWAVLRGKGWEVQPALRMNAGGITVLLTLLVIDLQLQPLLVQQAMEVNRMIPLACFLAIMSGIVYACLRVLVAEIPENLRPILDRLSDLAFHGALTIFLVALLAWHATVSV